jgi:hypothetical protein
MSVYLLIRLPEVKMSEFSFPSHFHRLYVLAISN